MTASWRIESRQPPIINRWPSRWLRGRGRKLQPQRGGSSKPLKPSCCFLLSQGLPVVSITRGALIVDHHLLALRRLQVNKNFGLPLRSARSIDPKHRFGPARVSEPLIQVAIPTQMVDFVFPLLPSRTPIGSDSNRLSRIGLLDINVTRPTCSNKPCQKKRYENRDPSKRPRAA